MIVIVASPLDILSYTSIERVHKALNHLQKGKGVILIDDEDRENEGELIFSAHTMSLAHMALMIRECSGIVCLCLSNEKSIHAPTTLYGKGKHKYFPNSLHYFDRGKRRNKHWCFSI